MCKSRGRIVFIAIVLGAVSLSLAAGNYMTPLDYYSSDKGKSLAQKYSINLQRAVTEVTSVYKRDELRLMTMDESAVGGAGFWKNPAKFETDNRYMGMIVYVKTPPFIFGQDRNGHVASVLDRYGKTILSALTKQLEASGGVDGVVIGIVWGDSISGDPTQGAAEALALFLARQDVILYKNFKLTIENLVNRNDLFLFNGSGEIENLLQFIIES